MKTSLYIKLTFSSQSVHYREVLCLWTCIGGNSFRILISGRNSLQVFVTELIIGLMIVMLCISLMKEYSGMQNLLNLVLWPTICCLLNQRLLLLCLSTCYTSFVICATAPHTTPSLPFLVLQGHPPFQLGFFNRLC